MSRHSTSKYLYDLVREHGTEDAIKILKKFSELRIEDEKKDLEINIEEVKSLSQKE